MGSAIASQVRVRRPRAAAATALPGRARSAATVMPCRGATAYRGEDPPPDRMVGRDDRRSPRASGLADPQTRDEADREAGVGHGDVGVELDALQAPHRLEAGRLAGGQRRLAAVGLERGSRPTGGRRSRRWPSPRAPGGRTSSRGSSSSGMRSTAASGSQRSEVVLVGQHDIVVAQRQLVPGQSRAVPDLGHPDLDRRVCGRGEARAPARGARRCPSRTPPRAAWTCSSAADEVEVRPGALQFRDDGVGAPDEDPGRLGEPDAATVPSRAGRRPPRARGPAAAARPPTGVKASASAAAARVPRRATSRSTRRLPDVEFHAAPPSRL